MKHTGEHLLRRWEHPGPKRILTLDGGGIRGVLTLQFLAEMEANLERRSNGQIRTLSQYFDLVGGTSTGSIIASLISLGWPVSQIQEAYRRLSKIAFKKKWLGQLTAGGLAPRFSTRSLKEELEKHLSIELGSDSVRTGLMIIARRVDSGSPWIMHNNPRGPYYSAPDGAGWRANSNFTLWELVLASSAAPSFFKPRRIVVGWRENRKPQVGLFADGGVTPFNNPAFQALRLVSLKGHGFEWELGRSNVVVVSVGTGSRPRKILGGGGLGRSGVFAVKTLLGLMDDCEVEAEMMMQWLSESDTARHIDSEVGKLEGDLLGGHELVLYSRYNVRLEEDWLANQLRIQRDDRDLEKLHKMDRVENIKDLESIGATAARKFVKDAHLPF